MNYIKIKANQGMAKKKEAEEINEEEPAQFWKGPIKVVIALFILLIVVMWVVPYYSVRLDPEPSNIPSIEEINSQFPLGNINGNGTKFSSITDAAQGIKTDDPLIRQIAARIASQSCTETKVCHAKALYYFVRDNIKYVSDPYAKEYVALPAETLSVGAGDCDDGALLLAALLEAVGIDTRIVIIPGHAFIKSLIPGAMQRYKVGDWVYMDWTCIDCSFGEVPFENIPHSSD